MFNSINIRRILRESVSKVLREDEASLNVNGSSNVGDSISSTDAKSDSKGTKSYSTPVSNISNSSSSSAGSDMVITGRSSSECQSKLQQSKNQNSQFYSNPANKVHFKVNPSGSFDF